MHERTRLSVDERDRDVLAALGESELTVRELTERLAGDRGWELLDPSLGDQHQLKQLSSLVYASLRHLRGRQVVTRARRPPGWGRGPSSWRYFKVERPPTGEFAAIVAALRTEEKAGG